VLFHAEFRPVGRTHAYTHTSFSVLADGCVCAHTHTHTREHTCAHALIRSLSKTVHLDTHSYRPVHTLCYIGQSWVLFFGCDHLVVDGCLSMNQSDGAGGAFVENPAVPIRTAGRFRLVNVFTVYTPCLCTRTCGLCQLISPGLGRSLEHYKIVRRHTHRTGAMNNDRPQYYYTMPKPQLSVDVSSAFVHSHLLRQLALLSADAFAPIWASHVLSQQAR
jgi:hypothetical protein